MFRRLLILGLMSAALCGVRLFAHDPGLSSAHVVRTDSRLEVRLTFAWSDLSPLTEKTAASERPAAGELESLGGELSRAGDRFVDVYSDNTRQSAAIPVVSPGAASANEVIVSLEWPRVAAGPLRIEFPILGKMAFGHRMVLTLDEATDAAALLDSRHATFALTAVTSVPVSSSPSVVASEPPRSSWMSFLGLGLEHILTGFDHLCFLFALLLVAVKAKEVIGVVTAFTVAHSLTLAAAATGLVSLSPKLVEPLIAASIVYIGVENLFLRRPPRHRMALVFGFGLVHGLGFATALAERLPGVTGFAIVPPLVGFNLGVELGQLAVAALLIPLLHFVRARFTQAARLQPAFSLVIAVAGIVWFCQRV
ncbi:MAG: HupE/UreJ family protein [Opitutaceae bacterium]